MIPTIHRLALALLLLALLATPDRFLAAQAPPPETGFQAETRVTAVDLVVEARNSLGTVSRGLRPEDLRVVSDGESLPVVATLPLGHDAGAEPWRLVVYVDQELTPAATLRSAAAALADRAAALAGLGSVEIILADPDPRLFLAASDDVDLIAEALSRIALDHEGRDRLGAVRRQALNPPPALAGAAAADPAALVAAAEAEEMELILAAQDRLLGWVAGEELRGPRALFLIQGGYDLDPGVFYRQRLSAGAGLAPAAGELARVTAATAQAVAAYGWTVFPVVAADFQPAPKDTMSDFDRFRYQTRDGPAGDSTAMVTRGVGLGKGRKGERAAAQPEESLLIDPSAPLASLAEATGGRLVGRAAALDELIRNLDRRLLITFQASWDLDGRVRPVKVESRTGKLELRAPAWVRSASPQAVAEARIRRIAAGDPEVGSLLVTVARASAAAGELGLEVAVDFAGETSAEPADRGPVRLSVALGREGGVPLYHHEILAAPPPGGAWRQHLTLPLTPGSEWAVALVESLADGQWGAQAIDLATPPPAR